MIRTLRSVVVRRSIGHYSNILRRLALGLVVAFGMFGVISYAQNLADETLAGPTVEVVDDGFGCPADHPEVLGVKVPGTNGDKNGDGIVCGNSDGDIVDNKPGHGGGNDDGDNFGCPADHPIVLIIKDPKTPGAKEDSNGDGIVCENEAGDIVDNNIGHEGGNDGKDSVTGHGNFFDGGKEGGGEEKDGKLPKFLDISFSFDAQSITAERRGDPDARGQFEYHTQLEGGADLTVHGEVLCLSAGKGGKDDKEGKGSANLVGIVTRSNDAGLPVDLIVTWTAADNGEGSNAEPDRVSRLSPVGHHGGHGICGGKFGEIFDQPIVSGNIQIHK